MMASPDFKDVIDRLKAEGQLTRNTGTNSLKSVRKSLEDISEKIVEQSNILTNIFDMEQNEIQRRITQERLSTVGRTEVGGDTNRSGRQAADRQARGSISRMTGIGSLFSGVGTGLGIAGMGIGVGLGAALLGLSTVIDRIPDANAIKSSVETLLSIGENYESRLDFFLDGGVLFSALTGIGAGLAAFSVGQGAQAAVDFFSKPDWTERVKTNVMTLLSIGDEMTLGSLQLLFDGAGVIAALSGLGIGLGFFGVGGAATAGVDYFSREGWAERVKTNVNTLLSIADGKTLGSLQLLFDGVGVGAALTGLGTGLAVFSTGQGIHAAVDFFSKPDWAENVKSSVATLLSITELPGFGADTLGFLGTMTGISAGLAIFAFGKGLDTIVEGVDQALAFFTGKDDFAQRIYDQVETLLRIPNIQGADVGDFIKSMIGITTGLAIFAIGRGGTAVIEGASRAIDFFSGGDDFAQRIYDQVETLVSITSLTDEGRAGQFATSLRAISAGILTFTTADFIGTLADAGQSILSFFGVESPFDKIVQIADKSDQLSQAASALLLISNALSSFGNITVSSSRINFEELAMDLGRAIPLFRGLAVGGIVGAGWLGFGGVDFERGIFDPTLRLDEIAERMSLVRSALTGSSLTVPVAPRINEPSAMPIPQGLPIDDESQYDLNPFRTGSRGFMDFGLGTPSILHGIEAVVPRNTLAGELLDKLFDDDWNRITPAQQATSQVLSEMNRFATSQQMQPIIINHTPVTNMPVNNITGGTNVSNQSMTSIRGGNGSGLGRFAN
jgi:hypothetical protein